MAFPFGWLARARSAPTSAGDNPKRSLPLPRPKPTVTMAAGDTFEDYESHSLWRNSILPSPVVIAFDPTARRGTGGSVRRRTCGGLETFVRRKEPQRLARL